MARHYCQLLREVRDTQRTEDAPVVRRQRDHHALVYLLDLEGHVVGRQFVGLVVAVRGADRALQAILAHEKELYAELHSAELHEGQRREENLTGA